MPKLVEMAAAAVLVVAMLAIIALATGIAEPHGVGRGYAMVDRLR